MILIKFVAFLRGINVGGHTLVKMGELKKAFEDLGFENVRTLLNSGNVIFEAKGRKVETLMIEEKLEKTFGFPITVILRTVGEIENLVAIDPFKNINITPETRLYMTFLKDEPKSTLRIPNTSPEKDFQILQLVDGAICSVIVISTNRNTSDLMKVIEKEFGKNVTTRNWKTIKKII